MILIRDLTGSEVIGGILGIGIAAFGIVDASRSIFGSIDLIGFMRVREMVVSLTPEGESIPENILPRADILKSLEANWRIGVDVVYQKELARSFIKIHLSPNNAAAIAARVNITPAILESVAAFLASGEPLPKPEIDIYERFELMVTALLDQAYQEASREYRNGMKSLAAMMCVVISASICLGLEGPILFMRTYDAALALLGGLAAVPIAPLAKDISSAVATAVRSRITKALSGN